VAELKICDAMKQCGLLDALGPGWCVVVVLSMLFGWQRKIKRNKNRRTAERA
jgi:hypothetical protein